MSQLTLSLRAIAKSANHPIGLLYTMQLESARKKYLVRGELAAGKKELELRAPDMEEGGEKAVGGKEEEKTLGLEEKGVSGVRSTIALVAVECEARWRCEDFLSSKNSSLPTRKGGGEAGRTLPSGDRGNGKTADMSLG